jgi:hypothetical protein
MCQAESNCISVFFIAHDLTLEACISSGKTFGGDMGIGALFYNPKNSELERRQL